MLKFRYFNVVRTRVKRQTLLEKLQMKGEFIGMRPDVIHCLVCFKNMVSINMQCGLGLRCSKQLKFLFLINNRPSAVTLHYQTTTKPGDIKRPT